MKRRVYSALLQDVSLPHAERDRAAWKLKKLPRNSSRTRLKNRCIFTGRARSVLQDFRSSRLCVRELARAGFLPGVAQASW